MENYSQKAAEIVTGKGHTFIKYVNSQEVHLKCGRCGETSTAAIFNIKQSKGACSRCFYKKSICSKSAREAEEFVRKRGHEFVRYESANKVVYNCGNCGTTTSSTKDTVKYAATMTCRACRFSKGPQYQNKIKTILARYGLKLAAPCRSMHNICYVCVCGRIVTAPLCVLKRGCVCENTRIE